MPTNRPTDEYLATLTESTQAYIADLERQLAEALVTCKTRFHALCAIATAAGVSPDLEPDKIAEAVCDTLERASEIVSAAYEIQRRCKPSDIRGQPWGDAICDLIHLVGREEKRAAAEQAKGEEVPHAE